MSQPFHKYDTGINYICSGAINFSVGPFILALSAIGPSQTTSVYTVANISEIATGGGYMQGSGIAISTPSLAQSPAGTSIFSGTAPLFTAVAPGVATFSHVILYSNTGSLPLIGWWDCAAAITMAATDTFQVSWAGNQILSFV